MSAIKISLREIYKDAIPLQTREASSNCSRENEAKGLRMKLVNELLDETTTILKSNTVLDSIHEVINQTKDEENPFMIIDVGDIISKVHYWRFKMPRIKPFYAIKSNDTKAVVLTLSSLGIGFDCASKREIEMVLELGVSPSRIVYANPCKGNYHLRYAAQNNVDLIVFDNESELLKIKDIFPEAKLLLRITSDSPSSELTFSKKFGATSDEVESLLKSAKSLDLNIIGVSFYVGSNVKDALGYTKGIEKSKKVFEAAKEMGFNPYLLDIGGGFPGSLGSTFDNIAEQINKALDTNFPEKETQVISEPGRYFVESSCTALTQVISTRIIHNKVRGNESSFMYYINDGIHGTFSAVLLDKFPVNPIPLRNFGKEFLESESDFQSSIWGPTCDSLDVIVHGTKMHKMEVGEWIVWENIGAYSISSTKTFNGFPKPKVYLLLSEKSLCILEDTLVCNELLNNN